MPNEDKMDIVNVYFPYHTFAEDAPALAQELMLSPTAGAQLPQNVVDPSVVLELRFPNTYPADPPFARVVRPRFQQWTGHVTIGGSICTAALTRSEWKPDISASALLLSLHRNIIDGQGRLLNSPNEPDYSFAEAREAFNRVARDHGWQI